MKSYVGDSNRFLEELFICLDIAGIDRDELRELDHLAYRVPTLDQYEAKKIEFVEMGQLVTESKIKGRPIAVFKLNDPILYDHYAINCIELPAPSDHKSFNEGLEHAEFVTKKPLSKFVEDHSDLSFKKNLDRPISAHVIIEFPHLAIKFHEKHLLDIVKIQEETGEI